ADRPAAEADLQIGLVVLDAVLGVVQGRVLARRLFAVAERCAATDRKAEAVEVVGEAQRAGVDVADLAVVVGRGRAGAVADVGDAAALGVGGLGRVGGGEAEAAEARAEVDDARALRRQAVAGAVGGAVAVHAGVGEV